MWKGLTHESRKRSRLDMIGDWMRLGRCPFGGLGRRRTTGAWPKRDIVSGEAKSLKRPKVDSSERAAAPMHVQDCSCLGESYYA